MKCARRFLLARLATGLVALLLGTLGVAYGILRRPQAMEVVPTKVPPAADGYLTTASATADDWPCLLGPNHDSTSRETGLVTSWPDTGPKEKWRRDIGAGYSVPVTAEGHLILFHRLGNEEIVEGLDAETGESQW